MQVTIEVELGTVRGGGVVRVTCEKGLERIVTLLPHELHSGRRSFPPGSMGATPGWSNAQDLGKQVLSDLLSKGFRNSKLDNELSGQIFQMSLPRYHPVTQYYIEPYSVKRRALAECLLAEAKTSASTQRFSAILFLARNFVTYSCVK